MGKSLPSANYVPGERLPLLDGLRGFAAIGVMLHHADNKFYFVTPFERGYLFVDLFFIMSGFVLALAAENRMNEGLGTRGFMRSRVKRLWPTLAVGALIGSVVMTLTSGNIDDLAWLTLLCLLIIPKFWGDSLLFPINAPYWSIFFEFIANLMHGLVLRKCSNMTLFVIVIIAAACNCTIIIVLSGNWFGPNALSWGGAIPRLAFSYTLGVWMARIWQSRSHRQIINWQSALILPIITVVVLDELPIGRGIGDALEVTIVMPALFWMAAIATVPSSANRLLSWFGTLSFPLYVVHVPILDMVWHHGKSWQMMFLAIASCFVAALAVGFFLEKSAKTSSRYGPGIGQPVTT